MDDQLLIVAIELLRRSIVDLNAAILANAQREPRDEGDDVRGPLGDRRPPGPAATAAQINAMRGGPTPAARPQQAKPDLTKSPAPQVVDPMTGFDVPVANRANTLAATGWPLLTAALNGLLAAQRGRQEQQAGPRMIEGGPRALPGPIHLGGKPPEPKALPAPPEPKPPPKQPRQQVRGYAESLFAKIAGLIQSILSAAKEAKATKKVKEAAKGTGRRLKSAAGRAKEAAKKVGARVKKGAQAVGARAKAIGQRIAKTTPAKRIRRDLQQLRKLFGKAKKSRLGRAATRAFKGATKKGRKLAGKAPGAAKKGLKSVAGKAGRGAVGGAGGFLMMLGNLVAEPFRRVAQVLSPMAILSETINSVASGFQLIGMSAKLLAATLAPLLLPVFFAIAVAVTEIADRMWADFEPGLEAIYKTILEDVLPALSAFVSGLQDVVDWFNHQLSKAGLADDPYAKDEEGNVRRDEEGRIIKRRDDTGAGDFSGETSSGAGGDYGGEGFGGPSQGSTGEGTGHKRGERKPEEKKEGGGVSNQTRRAIQDVLGELRTSVGPRANFGNIAGRARDVTLAGLNQSPFEQKILDRIGSAIGKLDKIANNTAKQPQPRHPGANESGGDF